MLTCVDTASRWPEAFPIRSTTSRTIIGHLMQIFTRWGFPLKLTSDNGPQFISSIFTKWLKDKGITHARATPYHPQANGIVERLHRTLNGVIAKTIECKGDWASVLPMALFFLRCTPNSSTGISPFLLTHGWEPSNPIQLLHKSWVDGELGGVDLSEWVLDNAERVETAREQATLRLIDNSKYRADMYNKNTRDRKFLVGDKVWVRRPGLDHKLKESWAGPGTVVKVNSPCSFRVQTPDRLIPTVHIQQLKLAESEYIKKITAVVQDTDQEDLTTSFAAANIQSQELTNEQQTELQQQLSRFSDVLTKEPGLTNLATFNIDTGEADPIQQRPYSTPVALKDSVNKELAWLLDKGYIVPSSSPWSSPMVMVRKADGSARICVDFRKANSLTRQIPFFMPRVEEVIEGIGKARFISKLDLSKGFYQVQLTDAAMEKTAFTCHKGAFHFTRTSKQAPQTLEWKDEGMIAFNCIRNFFCATPNLCVPLPSDVLSIVSDASGKGVGGVLQVRRDGEWTPSAYYSRQLRGAEARYSATELEALALVETVRHFAYHLYGRGFVAFTDHRPLEQLLSSTRLNPRLARMAYKLQHWLIEICYLPGMDNTLADALSREERSITSEDQTTQREGTQVTSGEQSNPQEDVTSPGRPSSGGGMWRERLHRGKNRQLETHAYNHKVEHLHIR